MTDDRRKLAVTGQRGDKIVLETTDKWGHTDKAIGLDPAEAAQLLRELAHAGAMPSETLRDLADTVAEREAWAQMPAASEAVATAVNAFPTGPEAAAREQSTTKAQPAGKQDPPGRTLRRHR